MSDQTINGVTVTGFLKPILAEKDHVEGGWKNTFDEIDIGRIVAGYACGNCAVTFSNFTEVCPVCHTTRDEQLAVRQASDDLQAYWNEHLYGTGDGKGGATVTNTIDDAIGAIMANPDIDHIRTSQLKPPRFGRGRPS